jgi:predicted GIY-YIG superfamily endonuclease
MRRIEIDNPTGYSIYVLREPSSELIRYVGLSNNPKKRLVKHIYHRKSDRTHKVNWIKLLRSKGLVPEMDILDDGLTLEEAKQKEIDYIKLFKACGAKLVNGTNGGDGGLGRRHTDMDRKKISERCRGKCRHTEEFKANLSKRMKGHKFHVGKKRSEEAKRKTSESLKEAYRSGKRKPRIYKHSDEWKENMRKIMTGRKFSDESIAKMREAAKHQPHLQRGRKLSAETKKRMLYARKNRQKPQE